MPGVWDMAVRLLIVDDIEALRVGVRTLLAGNGDWEVCGEAASGVEVIAKVRELQPDVVILDVSMPGMNGLEAASQIRRIAPSTKIILFTVHELRMAGLVDAVVSKWAPAQDLIAAIERVTGHFQNIPRQASAPASAAPQNP